MTQTKNNILVVEDDPDLLALIRQKLTDEGFKSTAIETGQQAIDYLKNGRPDLIILDILLPDIDGITVLQTIAHDNSTKDIPIIIFSNLDDQGSLEQVAAVGEYQYLVKAKTELKDLVVAIRKKLQ